MIIEGALVVERRGALREFGVGEVRLPRRAADAVPVELGKALRDVPLGSVR